MYKPVKVMPYSYTNLDGRVIDTNENAIGVGEFENEDSQSYNLICKIDKNVGDAVNPILSVIVVNVTLESTIVPPLFEIAPVTLNAAILFDACCFAIIVPINSIAWSDAITS